MGTLPAQLSRSRLWSGVIIIIISYVYIERIGQIAQETRRVSLHFKLLQSRHIRVRYLMPTVFTRHRDSGSLSKELK